MNTLLPDAEAIALVCWGVAAALFAKFLTGIPIEGDDPVYLPAELDLCKQ